MKLAVLPLLVGLTTHTVAQSPSFASPTRLQAGEKFLGQGRLFPSPVYHDIDGDGRADIVVGDLPGRLTMALRRAGDGAPTFGAETKVLGADGKQVDLQNW